MAGHSNIVHQYFKKELDGHLILLRINPIQLKGMELTVQPDGKVTRRNMPIDEHIYEDLKVDQFEEASAMEFNLYLAGLAGDM